MFNKRFLSGLFLVIVNFILIVANTSAETWTVESVDAPKYFGNFYQRAIAIDASGHPHIAYGGDHLYYVYYDGSNWRYETVDSSPGVGQYASIALDTAGKVHISYYDFNKGDLKYATNTSGTWVAVTVDGSEYVGQYTSLALDAKGKVHISYYDSDNGNLKYASNASGS